MTKRFIPPADRAWIAGVKRTAIAFWMTAAVLTAEGHEGSWCEAIPWDIGKVSADAESPWLQSLRFGGYIHLQAAAVNGRASNQDFSYKRGLDVRRTRLTMTGRALDALKFSVHANMSEDEGQSGGGVEFDYFGLFTAYAELDLTALVPATGLDTWSIGYGKRKLTELNEEDETSVNSILTVERSSFSSFVAPFRAATGTTGAWMRAGRGRNALRLGLFTTDSSPEFGAWNDGTLLIAAWEHDFSGALGVDEALLSIGGGIQNVQGRDEVYSPWEWILTPWFRLREGRWELRLSGACGELEGPPAVTGGAFFGGTVMPAYWLIENHLQLVGRYAVMSSEAPRGLQMASRYAREAGRPQNEGIPPLAAGRGDFHQAIYGGFVWWPCPRQLSLQGGIEWEQLTSRSANVYRGTTLWLSTRVIF